MAEVPRTIEGFVLDSLLLGDEARLPGPSESLVESGVIDLVAGNPGRVIAKDYDNSNKINFVVPSTGGGGS
jgi:hypothetical protein